MAEMLGLAKGVLADGKVTEDEAMALINWADEHPDVILAWPANVLYRRLRAVFEDGYASPEEREDLAGLLQELIGGEPGTVGGETKTTGLPLNDPPPTMEIPDRTFVFTGRFAFGTRKACEEAVKKLAGWAEPRVTQRTDYLIVGTFVSRDWLQTSYGRKILKAVELRDKTSCPEIISEEHWVASL
jgi:NAD-dependent DNA ligase